MLTQQPQIHINDRKAHAKQLGISLLEFDILVASANYAYTVFYDLGPFYGNETIKEPTFRVAAEPVQLPRGSQVLLTQLGNDILTLGKTLPVLPQEAKKTLGPGLDFRIPLTWRIDTIIDEHGAIKVNEIEGLDGASALMMAEQFAYNIQSPSKSTAARLGATIKKLFPHKAETSIRLALLRSDIIGNHITPNVRRFLSYIYELSNGVIEIDLIDELTVRDTMQKWETYDGILNETSLAPEVLYTLGVKEEQILSSGNYNALVNKGVFALLFDKTLQPFWKEQLGAACLKRLQKILIPSHFIETAEALTKARDAKKVVKVSWAGANTQLIHCSRGVALPNGSVDHSDDEQWTMLQEFLASGAKLIAQDFIIPGKMHAFLRKKGTTLESVEWYNRVCVKYVADNNPHETETPNVELTGVEVTLGPDIIPAGRRCAFTAGSF